jgi:hypothetical protein
MIILLFPSNDLFHALTYSDVIKSKDVMAWIFFKALEKNFGVHIVLCHQHTKTVRHMHCTQVPFAIDRWNFQYLIFYFGAEFHGQFIKPDMVVCMIKRKPDHSSKIGIKKDMYNFIYR